MGGKISSSNKNIHAFTRRIRFEKINNGRVSEGKPTELMISFGRSYPDRQIGGSYPTDHRTDKRVANHFKKISLVVSETDLVCTRECIPVYDNRITENARSRLKGGNQ